MFEQARVRARVRHRFKVGLAKAKDGARATGRAERAETDNEGCQ